jgi:multidrug resistance efflux pump
MDVSKKIAKGPRWGKRTKLAAAVGMSVLALVLFLAGSRNAVAVSEHDLVIDAVQKGSLDITIEGYGELISAKQTLLTSPSQATVQEIVLKPGAEVKADSVIVRLQDPELVQKYEAARQALNTAQATFRQLELTNQRETIKEEGAQAELEALQKTATAKRTAEEGLAKTGVVTKLTFAQTVEDEKQLNIRAELGKKGMKQLDQVHKESLRIQDDQVKQMEANLTVAQIQLDRLTVHAGMDGVLQKLPVEMGQSLPPGAEVALVGSATDLVALIRVPQGQAQSVHIGNDATIDTRREKIRGKVSRIVPIVANNTVEIEVALADIKGTSARPNLSVDGTIIGDRLEHITYVRRPARVNANTTVQAYAIASGSTDAQPKQVRFGRLAGQYIEILAGADVGERLVVSDLTDLKLDGGRLRIQ